VNIRDSEAPCNETFSTTLPIPVPLDQILLPPRCSQYVYRRSLSHKDIANEAVSMSENTDVQLVRFAGEHSVLYGC
jgi:hypothetical protein